MKKILFTILLALFLLPATIVSAADCESDADCNTGFDCLAGICQYADAPSLQGNRVCEQRQVTDLSKACYSSETRGDLKTDCKSADPFTVETQTKREYQVYFNVCCCSVKSSNNTSETVTTKAKENISFTPSVTIPGSDFKQGVEYQVDNSTRGIADYINAFYRFAIGGAAILAFLMILMGGMAWNESGGNQEKISEAKKRITSGILGLLLVMLSALFLNVINTDLTNFNIRAIDETKEANRLVCCNGSTGGTSITYYVNNDNQKIDTSTQKPASCPTGESLCGPEQDCLRFKNDSQFSCYATGVQCGGSISNRCLPDKPLGYDIALGVKDCRTAYGSTTYYKCYQKVNEIGGACGKLESNYDIWGTCRLSCLTGESKTNKGIDCGNGLTCCK